MTFGNWGPTTIWQNKESVTSFFSKSLHPTAQQWAQSSFTEPVFSDTPESESANYHRINCTVHNFSPFEFKLKTLIKTRSVFMTLFYHILCFGHWTHERVLTLSCKTFLFFLIPGTNLHILWVCDVFRKNKKVLFRPLSSAGNDEIEALCDWAR